jgi:tRNA threonylcarbamoyladenosine biosynthesis protein TsaE
VTTDSVDATMALARRLAETLSPGAVVALDGDLGTGKTHFVKGLAAGLGIPPETVRSPTFTIVHEYTDGRLPLYHFDAYRIGDPSELEAIGFDEYAYGDGITVIEWAARVADLLPPDTLRLRLTHVSAHERRIERVSR